MSEIFEGRNMAGTLFQRINLDQVKFHDVNLNQAEFDDVNLQGATIHNANLGNFTITDAYIKGMTVFGIRVDQLIEAELDRRDPVRGSLRMSDPFDPEVVRVVMKRLEDTRRAFCNELQAVDAKALTTRPEPCRWSVIEILRHLVFAEDLYLNRWMLRNEEPFNPVGLLPSFLANDPMYAKVGSEPSQSLEVVHKAWESIHARMQAFLAGVTREQLKRDTSDRDFGQGTVGGILQGMALHDLGHIRRVETILAELKSPANPITIKK